MKQKEICLHQLFSELHNYFSTKSPALQYTSANAALVFKFALKNNWCFVFETISPLHTSPYPPSYCTHINTLITINGLHSSMNFNWRKFFRMQHSPTPFYFPPQQPLLENPRSMLFLLCDRQSFTPT